MRVKVRRIPGTVLELEFTSGATVAELLCRLKYCDDDGFHVRLNGKEALPFDELADGDELMVAFPITGSAPMPPGHVAEGIRLLREFTTGAEELILIDPYLLRPRRGSDPSGYVRLFSDCTNITAGKLKRVQAVYAWRYHDADVLGRLSDLCARHGCELTAKYTTDVHDRLWVKDQTHGLLVGTSLNSIGGRLAFALPLPADDLHFLLDFLGRRSLINHKST